MSMVDNPRHYTEGKKHGWETIRVIENELSDEEYVGFLKGQILKYTSRLGAKDAPHQEAGKIRWYATELERVLAQEKP